eukprot:200384_1
MAEEKKEFEAYSQPFPDARPSIEPAEDFDEDMAAAAAKKLREAMKGMGTNEKKIIQVTNGFNRAQRMVISTTFTAEFKRDLIKDLKSELSGKFEKLALGFWSEPGVFDAEQVLEACSGMGFNTDLMNEIICTRTNEEIAAMKAQWSTFKKDKTLEERVQDETEKMFGSGSYSELLGQILKGERPENGPVDEEEAQSDAEELNRFLSQEKKDDAKAKFIAIFTTRSWTRLREISGRFQDVAKKYTLNGAIQETFGDGDTSKALQVIDEFVTQPYDFWAKKLQKAMKGMGTDDELLRRIVISRAENDLRSVGIVFGQRYGDGKTLQKWIKDDTSGDYEKLLLAVCGLD